MVRVYLKQELPSSYCDLIDDRILIKLPDNGQPFNVNFDRVFGMISERVKEIRDRHYELNFTVQSPNQLRDFTILK
jgi:hypothetical protein